MITLERSTPSQRKKIELIEKWMNIKFKGCVTSKVDCQLFIDDPNQKWTIDMFSYYNREDNDYPYICVSYCIPYTEHI